jgi:hypothetical protein
MKIFCSIDISALIVGFAQYYLREVNRQGNRIKMFAGTV